LAIELSLWLIFRRGPNAFRASGMAVLAAVSIGVLVLGYDPYVTNMKQGLHPLYPLAGPNKRDIMARQRPVVFAEYPDARLHEFAYSFFAQSQAIQDRTEPSHLKIPFTVSKRELMSFINPDALLAGWGVFFSGITLVSLILFLRVKGWREIPAVLALGFVAATAVINPEFWWARFAPQIAVVPALLLMPVFRTSSSRMLAAARLVVALFFLNNLICGAVLAGASYVKSKKLNGEFAQLAQASGKGEYWAYNMPGNKVHYDQFSGRKGIVICAQIDAPKALLPSDGFPLSTNIVRPEAHVLLVRGKCSSGPPLQ
jgi:hypothetical protein